MRALEPDPRGGVAGQWHHRFLERGIRLDEILGENQRVLPDAGVGITERNADILRGQSPESPQGPQGVEAGEGIHGVAGELAQRRHRGRGFALEQQPLGGESPPLIGVPQMPDQLRISRLLEPRRDGLQAALRRDAPDAALVGSRPQIELRLLGIADVVGMLNHRPLHGDDIQGAVGSGFHGHRAEMRIPAGQELTPGLELAADADERVIDEADLVAMHEISDHVAHEHRSAILGRKVCGSDDPHAAGRAEVSGLLGMIRSRHRIGDRKDPAHLLMVGNGDRGGDRREGAEAPHLVVRKDRVLEMVDVVGEEGVAEVVDGLAKAAATAMGQRDDAGLGIIGEVLLAQLHRRGAGGGGL